MSGQVRVRFAPSPTGPLHMGGVRTALYNYLFARRQGGRFILRIEDTDQSRYVDKAEQYIREALHWCGLDWDEGPEQGGAYGPYRQSERKAGYGEYAQKLVEAGHAYYAFDTSEELEAMRERMRKQGVPNPQYNAVTRTYMKNSLTLPSDEVRQCLKKGDPYVVRIKVPRKTEVKVNDMIRGWVTFQSNQLDDKVLLKADGMPTYHLANVADDHAMKITHVIRGEEWLPSTPIHVLLYRFLGLEEEMPAFAHLPLILRPDGKGKLSKREAERHGFPLFPLSWKDPDTGAVNPGFRETGFFPEAFINMLAFLGWNPGTEQELFTMDELIETFSLERVGKAGARFNYEKAKWFNEQYLKRKEDAFLAGKLHQILKEKNLTSPDEDYLKAVCRLLKERATFMPDLWTQGRFFFEAPTQYDEKTVQKKWKPETPGLLEALKTKFAGHEELSADHIQVAMEEVAKEKEVGKGRLMPIFRLALSGMGAGPPLFEMAALLGKEEVLARIDRALQAIPEPKD